MTSPLTPVFTTHHSTTHSLLGSVHKERRRSFRRLNRDRVPAGLDHRSLHFWPAVRLVPAIAKSIEAGWPPVITREDIERRIRRVIVNAVLLAQLPVGQAHKV